MSGNFYRQVEILDRVRHAELRLQPATDIHYAANLRDCPLVADEFSEAAKAYPIVFSRDQAGQTMAVVVMGFPGGGNLWLDANSHWLTVNYVPAYVRRYPFAAVEMDGDFFLGLDMAFEGIGAENGELLFDSQGQPTPFLHNAGSFVDEFIRGHARTQTFLTELDRLNLLRPFNAEIWVGEQTAAALVNLLCIDKSRLETLPACELIDFVRNGHYALAVAHMASLSNFRTITARMTNSENP